MAHWLGTDDQARDTWSRIIWGARRSLRVGLGALALGTIIGPLPLDPWIRTTVLSNLSLEYRKFRWIAILGPGGAVLSESQLEDSAASPHGAP